MYDYDLFLHERHHALVKHASISWTIDKLEERHPIPVPIKPYPDIMYNSYHA